MTTLRVLGLGCAVAIGCGGDGGADAPDGGDMQEVDAAPAGEWFTLVEGAWTLPSPSEEYVCVYATLTETIYVTAMEPTAPLGTHHTFVSIGPPANADGVVPCGPNANYATFVAGSGVGTPAFEFPEGVALKLEAGQQLLLNLHLFNYSDETLAGTSGLRVKTLPADEVVAEAEAVVTGNTTFSLPPGESTALGSCTMTGDVTLFGVFPHMHMLGTNLRVDATTEAQGEVVLHDEPFAFDDQRIYDVGPIELRAGDRVSASCTWDNTTGDTVGFGDSSLEEMCFVVMYSYPDLGRPLMCID